MGRKTDIAESLEIQEVESLREDVAVRGILDGYGFIAVVVGADVADMELFAARILGIRIHSPGRVKLVFWGAPEGEMVSTRSKRARRIVEYLLSALPPLVDEYQARCKLMAAAASETATVQLRPVQAALRTERRESHESLSAWEEYCKRENIPDLQSAVPRGRNRGPRL